MGTHTSSCDVGICNKVQNYNLTFYLTDDFVKKYHNLWPYNIMWLHEEDRTDQFLEEAAEADVIITS